MRLALEEAHAAAGHGDVPVGAVLIQGDTILARAHNRREVDGDPTAHAELVVLRMAAARRGQWRLEGTVLYVTLEPCAMCAGALVNARVSALVFGAYDPKAGAVGSLMNLCQDARLNHRLEVTGGVLADECARALRDFFQERRASREARGRYKDRS